MELLLIIAFLACIPAAIADSKGHSFALWWTYGFFLFIIALIHSLMLTDKVNTKVCVQCLNRIPKAALKCGCCGSEQ